MTNKQRMDVGLASGPSPARLFQTNLTLSVFIQA